MLKEIRVLSCANIPELVLVSAHFSGFIKRVFLRDGVEILDSRKDNGDTIQTIRFPGNRIRGDDFIHSHWTSMEEIINESFNAILLTLPPESLGRLVTKLFGLKEDMPLYVAELIWRKDISPAVGDPDIVLCDKSQKHIFLIELKIQAKTSNGKFSLQQHTKYSNCIQVLEAEGRTARAILLAPSDDYKSCIPSREVGWFDYANGTLLPNKARIDGKPLFVSNKQVIDFASFIEYQNDHIKTYGLKVKPDEYRPIKFRSFFEFREALKSAAPHLTEAFSLIEKYSSL